MHQDLTVLTDYGHFAYETLRPVDSSPAPWTVHLLHTLPTVTTRLHIRLYLYGCCINSDHAILVIHRITV